MATSLLLQRVHAQFLGQSIGLSLPAEDKKPWVIANGYYSLPEAEDRSAMFRSKQLAPEFASEGRCITISLMVDDRGREYLTASFQYLGQDDPQFEGIGFLSLNTEAGYDETGIFAGGKLQEDSAAAEMGYTHHQLFVNSEGLMELRVF